MVCHVVIPKLRETYVLRPTPKPRDIFMGGWEIGWRVALAEAATWHLVNCVLTVVTHYTHLPSLALKRQLAVVAEIENSGWVACSLFTFKKIMPHRYFVPPLVCKTTKHRKPSKTWAIRRSVKSTYRVFLLEMMHPFVLDFQVARTSLTTVFSPHPHLRKERICCCCCSLLLFDAVLCLPLWTNFI